MSSSDSGKQGKVQEEELDSCRAEPASGGWQRDEGGREKPARVLPARNFAQQNEGRRDAAPPGIVARPLSSQPWLSAAWPSLPSLSQRTPASP
jgi:hypothetical protein